MERQDLKRDKEVCGGNSSAETWMEKEKHLGLGYCIPVQETERPQHDEEQDHREAKRKGSSQPPELSEGSRHDPTTGAYRSATPSTILELIST